MNNMKKILALATGLGVFGLARPVVAQTKNGAAALALLAASGGLGYVAKKAYQKIQLAQTETEKGRAQRRFILAVLGALAAGAGTAYAGHKYFNDSSEQQAPAAPGAQMTSAVSQSSRGARDGRAVTTRKPRRKRDGQIPRVEKLLASVAVSAVPDIEQAPAVAAVPAAPGLRSGPPAAEEDLACVLDPNLCVQRSSGTDFSLSALAAENIRAVLRRDGVVPSQFCRMPRPDSYFLTGRRGDGQEYLYLFDLDGRQMRSEDFQSGFKGCSQVSANSQMIYRDAESINARLERAAAPGRGAPAVTAMGARTISVHLTESGPVQSIELLADGRLSEASRRALHPFNLRGRIALPTELGSFAMVVKLEKLSEFPDTFLCVSVEGRVFWFESVAGDRVRAASDLNYLSRGLTSRQLLIKAVGLPSTETFLPLEGGLSLGLRLRDAQRIELSHLHTTPAQLLANSRGCNWAGLPEVPAIIRERRPAAAGWRGYVVLRYEVPGVSDLWIGVDVESGGDCIAVMDDRRMLNTVLLDVIGRRPILRMQPEALPLAVRQARLKEDLVRMLEAGDRGLAGTIRSNPDITEEILRNFSGVGSSLMKELIERWDERFYDTFSEIVAALQERLPAIDWVNADIRSRAPACHAIDSNKLVLAQALLGVPDAGRAASVTIHGGLTVLHYAVYRAEPAALAQLFTGGTSSRDRAVQRLRSVLNQPDAQGLTPLMLAMQMQDFAYARVLIENGAALVNPQGQDICAYAANVSTKAVFDALCAHERVASELRHNVQWRPSNAQRGVVPTFGRQQFRSQRGEQITVTYDVTAGVMDAQSMQRLHQVNSAGSRRVSGQPLLRDYPLVIFFLDNSMGARYWMCVDARGRATLRYADEGLAYVSDGEEPGTGVAFLHLIQH